MSYFITQISVNCKSDALGLNEWNAETSVCLTVYIVNSVGFKLPINISF